MARRAIFTKEQILKKTCDFIKSNGINSMNARDLCKYIGCSTQPIFKNFDSMEELKKNLKDYLHNYYEQFIDVIVNKENYLFTISYAYALFAFRESNIFKALFMSDLAGSRTIKEVLVSSHNIETIEAITIQYGLSKKQVENLYRDVRFYTHGLACQIACNSIVVDEKEIEILVSGIIKKLKEMV